MSAVKKRTLELLITRITLKRLNLDGHMVCTLNAFTLYLISRRFPKDICVCALKSVLVLFIRSQKVNGYKNGQLPCKLNLRYLKKERPEKIHVALVVDIMSDWRPRLATSSGKYDPFLRSFDLECQVFLWCSCERRLAKDL